MCSSDSSPIELATSVMTSGGSSGAAASWYEETSWLADR
jgi:hypothetical protein